LSAPRALARVEMKLSEHLAEYKENGFTVFPALHSPQWVAETRAMLEPDFQRHFELADRGPFWQGAGAASGGGRVAVAPGLQAFEHDGPFGARLMDSIVCNETMLDFAQLVMGPFVQLDSCEVTGYPADPVAAAAAAAIAPHGGSSSVPTSPPPPGAAWHRDGFDTSKVWSEGAPTQRWRPGTSMQASAAAPRVEAPRRSYTPPLACNYLTCGC
jgi:hypothetical protein